MKAPQELTVKDVLYLKDNLTYTNEGWVPARPLFVTSFIKRVQLAWLVFTGRRDALKWSGGQ